MPLERFPAFTQDFITVGGQPAPDAHGKFEVVDAQIRGGGLGCQAEGPSKEAMRIEDEAGVIDQEPGVRNPALTVLFFKDEGPLRP